ncbi:co-chaperone GroES, partial [Bradyrhizobium sp. LVM 105]
AGQSCPPSGRNSTYRAVQICGTSSVGDRVLFGKWSGTEVKINSEELLIMKESDIMGVLTDVFSNKKAA